MPSNRLSISMLVCALLDSVRFARSQAVRRRRSARALPCNGHTRFLTSETLQSQDPILGKGNTM